MSTEKMKSSNEKINFRLRLRQVVDGHGSVNSFAKEVGVSEAAVRKWLNGTSEPKFTHFTKICEIGEVELEWLSGGENLGSKQKFELSHQDGHDFFYYVIITVSFGVILFLLFFSVLMEIR